MTRRIVMSKLSLLTWAGLTAAALAMGAGVVFAFSIPGLGSSEKVQPVNGVISIQLDRVSDGKAHFYQVAEGGRKIDFFVVKGSDGVFRTAFDACDVCFHEKKGYVQEGNFMICRNCNRKFAIGKIGRMNSGGCNPSYLEHTGDGRNIYIKVADIRPGARFF
jgi:uncharacterized membrane protein